MTSTSKYVKLEHKEHVLIRPDTYVGSIQSAKEDCWVLDNSSSLPRMILKNIKRVQGEYKIFDEIIVNAHDQWIRMNEEHKKNKNINLVKNIKISYDEINGEICVYNDGDGIPVVLHDTENIYIPEMIFGSLLTSSNYDDDDLKHVGGKNGYGAKLTNIFSKKFSIETCDKNTKLKFNQTFYDNMTRRDKPKITSYKSKPFTKVTYIPDYIRFGKKGLDKNMIEIIRKRAYDLAACTSGSVNVYLNEELIKIKSFGKYIDYFIGTSVERPRAFEIVNDRWEVGVCLNDDMTFSQISFVNGILTNRGGKHVEYIANQISRKLAEVILKKKKRKVKPNFIKENLMVFVKCTIDNPSFNSQTKEHLDTVSSQFGSTCKLSDKFIEQAAKCGIMERACELSQVKDMKDLSKTDGKKKSHIQGIPKLEDANWAGTAKSGKCTLILTEGDSAKAMVMGGLPSNAKDYFGVFPLRGKIINVRDAGKDNKKLKQISENTEINALKKIIGLQNGKIYKSTDELRYGHILILTDQDEDGSHIKGLFFNLFEVMWPSLFYMDGFIQSMLTPIVKTTKGKKIKVFYSLKNYENWLEDNAVGNWKPKYYKGLGTSTPKEAKEYFKTPKIINYETDKERDGKTLVLAFDKKHANNRKDWLMDYSKDLTLDYNSMNVQVNDFINKELIHFSNADNIRSIPHLCDGLKPSLRKVLFSCFKRNLTNEIKVAQLAGYVSEHSAYHHGEASLQGAIINMAQTYIGSNNINLLEPVGQFGSRVSGGKDAGQPRYIFTQLTPLAFKLFNKQDTPILNHLDDDGNKIEPEYYIPILPMILVNGSSGIGTGWSTNIPSHNPKDIANNIIRHLRGDKLEPLYPWYRGFKGDIVKETETKFISKGKYTISGDTIEITELPVHTWTDKYKEYLEMIIIEKTKEKSKKPNLIRYYDSYCTDVDIRFILYFPKGELSKKKWTDSYIMDKLNLTSSISYTNMNYYGADGKITKSTDPCDILKQYVDVRIKAYGQRKQYLLQLWNDETEILMNKVRFINETIKNKVKIQRVSKADIESQLINRKYMKIENSFSYLLGMPIYSLTKEKIEELEDKLKQKQNELDSLKNKTTHDLYKEDIKDIAKEIKELVKQ